MDELLQELKNCKFDKQLKKYNKKFRNKKIVLYGMGSFFKTIKDNYDLSELNIIGVSDKKYTENDEGKEVFGYRIIPLEKVADSNPDIVMVSTLRTLDIIDKLTFDTFRGSKIKVLPFVDKPFFTLLKELFNI